MTDTGGLNNGTLLILDGMGVPLYSARGLTQTLAPIQQAAQIKRTVNGDLIDVSDANFRKYSTTISCNDRRAPAIGGIWPGMTVTIDCVAELNYLTGIGTPERPAVEGSSYEEGDFTFYRPRLICKVMNITQQIDEYGAKVGWQLDAEETGDLATGSA